MASASVRAVLIGVVAALLVVGVVSHTPLRHCVQVAPGIAVLGLQHFRREAARFAALAIFVFWLSMMVLIWLFLLGIARVVTGHFTPVEIALTIVIGLASAIGIVAATRADGTSRWPARIAAFVAGAACQVGATWLSIQPMLANR